MTSAEFFRDSPAWNHVLLAVKSAQLMFLFGLEGKPSEPEKPTDSPLVSPQDGAKSSGHLWQRLMRWGYRPASSGV